jgi:hypothetical protein
MESEIFRIDYFKESIQSMVKTQANSEIIIKYLAMVLANQEDKPQSDIYAAMIHERDLRGQEILDEMPKYTN